MFAIRALSKCHFGKLNRIVISRNYVLQHPFVGVTDNERLTKIIEEKGRPDLLSQYKKFMRELDDLSDLRKTSEKDMLNLVDVEITDVLLKVKELQGDILDGIAHDQDIAVNSLILEINCGVGGQEAMLFAGEMLSVYENYIQLKGWTAVVLNTDETNIGGMNSATLQVDGRNCFQFLRHEAGVHRVQRIPKTERNGRIHTSTITVNVIPISGEELEIVIDAKDLKTDAKRSTGAGGQHVNKTESCAVVTHLPTGTVVECQEERTFVVNRRKAIDKLKNILLMKKKEQLSAAHEETRKNQVSSAARSEKVRTYNFVQDRITDHRLTDNIYGVRDFMENSKSQKLDGLVQQLELKHKAELLEKLMSSNK